MLAVIFFVQERLPELEAEQARLAEMGPKLSIELGEIKRQCKQHDPKVTIKCFYLQYI